MKIQKIHTSKINPAPYNPRKDLQPNDPEYQKLKRSIDEFGCVEPLVWNARSGNLVGGHQRFKILLDQGLTAVQVSVVDLPPEREKALNIALNKISGDWDEQKLAELLDELVNFPEIDVEITGFTIPDIDDLLAKVNGEPDDGRKDDVDVLELLDLDRAAITKPGELIELGQHRLLCGDSTDPEQVRLVMNGQRASLFATDPPYLVNYDGTNHPVKRGGKGKAQRGSGGGDKNKDWSGTYGITWDDADANPDLYENFIRAAVDVAILPDAAWYCWHASRRQGMVEAAWEKYGAFVHQQIIWVKDRPILTRSWYSWQHEPCFFGWVRPKKPKRAADDYPTTIWSIPTVPVGQPTEHPTSKPVQLFAIPMHQHTRRGDICYEPFCGSGSQLIAAEKLGRRCFAIEISPHYCDVIVRRWIEYVGTGTAPKALVERYTRSKKDAAQ